MTHTKLMRTKWYPRPHDFHYSWRVAPYNTTGATSVGQLSNVIISLAFNDEGLGAPNLYNANPEHTGYTVASTANCYPESTISNFFCEVRTRLDKDATQVSLPSVTVGFQPMFMSFLSDYTAVEERTTETSAALMGMQSESTDRQGYPILDVSAEYNASDKDDGAVIPVANQPSGADNLKEVDFDIEKFYDVIQYYQMSNKIKTMQGGLNWRNLGSFQNTRTRFMVKLRSKVKRINPYTFFGIRCIVPQVATGYQDVAQHEVSQGDQSVHFDIRVRYLEWNQDFYMARAGTH